MDSLENLKRAGVPIKTIIDVGVNFSTPSLMRAFPKHKHVLIEPISDYFNTIKKNYQGFDYHLIEAAANDIDAEVFIETEAKFGGNAVTHSRIVDKASANTRTVPSLRLDTMLAALDLEEPYLLKIDVEGKDVPVSILRGAPETLKRSSCVVIEVTVERFAERVAEVGKAGFQLYDLEDMVYYRDTLWQMDAVFVRNDIIEKTPALRPMSVPPFDKRYWKHAQPIWERVARRVKERIGA